MKNRLGLVGLLIALMLTGVSGSIWAQTTAFTYQGSLEDEGSPANGAFQMRFKLFDAAAGGFQIGPTVDDVPITAVEGVFTARLDFGSNALSGANRWLEIAVRRGSAGSYTILSPREQLASAPYAVRTLSATNADVATNALNADMANNALNLGGQPAIQYVQTNDTRLSDARSPLPGSTNYIQNATAQQATSNFNISGTGTATTFSAATQFNIGASRVLSIGGTRNTFAGAGAGQSNVQGTDNAFFGYNAGLANVGNDIGIAGNFNSYFGSRAGESNSLGRFNSFFGSGAGRLNTGNNNAIFGAGAGEGSTTGTDNSIFGTAAGQSATSGNENSFFGMQAGAGFTAFGDPPTPNSASGNSYFGTRAGLKTSTGNFNSFFGLYAGESNRTASGNSFFGAFAGQNTTSGEDNAVFGAYAGMSNVAGDSNAFFGSGAGRNTITGLNSFFGGEAGKNTTSGSRNTFVGMGSGLTNIGGSSNTVVGYAANVSSASSNFETVLGAGAVGYGSNTVTLGRANDIVIVPSYLIARRGLIGEESTSFAAVYAQNSADGPGLIASSFTGYAADFRGTGSILVRGQLHVEGWPGGGTTSVCRAGIVFSTCGSSIRYKTDIQYFPGGLDLINRLRPVSYNWKSDGKPDIGLIAEEVAEAEPLLITRNEIGQVEGVKYDRLTIVLINAVKEQQAEIQTQQKQIDALKKLVCPQNPQADVCKEEEE